MSDIHPNGSWRAKELAKIINEENAKTNLIIGLAIALILTCAALGWIIYQLGTFHFG